MTPTERLRELLDERGVKHFDHDEGEPLRDLSEAGPDPATSWLMGDASVCAVPNKNGTFDLWIDHVTPEHAVEATLGRGECHLINAGEDCGKGIPSIMCFECGYTAPDECWNDAKYCPNCGRKVVDE